MKKILTAIGMFFPLFLISQYSSKNTVKVLVDFNKPLQEWDGFGVTYIQAGQTTDYEIDPQDFGGFSILQLKEKEKALNAIFGRNGLQPAIVKIFLDPLHQTAPKSAFDHSISTASILEFLEKGLAITHQHKSEFSIFSSLYAPPIYTWDINENAVNVLTSNYLEKVVGYVDSWVQFLSNEKKLPLTYMSPHYLGDARKDWAFKQVKEKNEEREGYHAFWSSNLYHQLLRKSTFQSVGLTSGELSGWRQLARFHKNILKDEVALNKLSLITLSSLGKEVINQGVIQTLKSTKPLKIWITDSNVDIGFDMISQVHRDIYTGGINAFIPPPIIQRTKDWKGNMPKGGFEVTEAGELKVLEGYYWYKQLCRAGKKGMFIAETESQLNTLNVIGFGKNKTVHSDAFVLAHKGLIDPELHDQLNVFINGHEFTFSLEDPVLNLNDTVTYSDIQYASMLESKGYRAEIVIPWEQVGVKIEGKNQKIPFNVEVLDGDTKTLIDWKEDSFMGLTENAIGDIKDSLVTVGPKDPKYTIKVDGFNEYTMVNNVAATVPISSTEAMVDFKGRWEAVYDDENLYLWVRVMDKSNEQGRRVLIFLDGTTSATFKGYRTTVDGEKYKYIGNFEVKNGRILYNAPYRSVTTFIGK